MLSPLSHRFFNQTFYVGENKEVELLSDKFSGNWNVAQTNFTLKDFSEYPSKGYITKGLDAAGLSKLEDEKLSVKELVERLCDSMSEKPKESIIFPTSRLKVKLMPHQNYAVTWCLWREQCKPCGGLLGKIVGFKHFIFF